MNSRGSNNNKQTYAISDWTYLCLAIRLDLCRISAIVSDHVCTILLLANAIL